MIVLFVDKNIIRIFGRVMMQRTPSAEKCRTGVTPKTESVFIEPPVVRAGPPLAIFPAESRSGRAAFAKRPNGLGAEENC